MHNFKSGILTELTIQKEGYSPDEYTDNSLKFIWAICRFCGQPSRLRKAFFHKAGSACHKQCRIEEQRRASPFKSQEVQQKARNTILNKYGVNSPSQCPAIARKISLTKRSLTVSSSQQEFVNCFQDNSKIEHLPFKSRIFFENDQICIQYNKLDGAGEVKWIQSDSQELNAIGIRVIHVFEYQWEQKKSQILGFVQSQLKNNNSCIGGRKCTISHDDGFEFIEQNHIQGGPSLVKQYFNLVNNNQIVGSMSASLHHRQNSSSSNIVLSRLCFLPGITIQGGASRLFSAFISWAKQQKYESIISWSDNCWTKGSIYKTLNFNLQKEYRKDYFYWDSTKKKIVSKQSQQKKKTNCPEGLTEREWCYQNGLYRIWDCGKKMWNYDLKETEP